MWPRLRPVPRGLGELSAPHPKSSTLAQAAWECWTIRDYPIQEGLPRGPQTTWRPSGRLCAQDAGKGSL